MVTIIVLTVYIIGVVLSHHLILSWREDGIIIRTEDCKNLFLVSLFSWFSIIMYIITRLFNDTEGEL